MFEQSGYEKELAAGTGEFITVFASYLLISAAPANRVDPAALEDVLLEFARSSRQRISPIAFELLQTLIGNLRLSVEQIQRASDDSSVG